MDAGNVKSEAKAAVNDKINQAKAEAEAKAKAESEAKARAAAEAAAKVAAESKACVDGIVVLAKAGTIRFATGKAELATESGVTLDKIAAQGIESLTQAERMMLDEWSKRLRELS